MYVCNYCGYSSQFPLYDRNNVTCLSAPVEIEFYMHKGCKGQMTDDTPIFKISESCRPFIKSLMGYHWPSDAKYGIGAKNVE